jgi:hypothetical protein
MTRSWRSVRPVQMKLSAQHGGVERQEKKPTHPTMYLIVFLVYLKIVPISTGTHHFFLTPDTNKVP